MNEMPGSSRRAAKAFIAALGLAAAALPAPARADIVYLPTSIFIPSELPPLAPFDFQFGGFSASFSSSVTDFTAVTFPSPSGSGVSIAVVPLAQQAEGAPQYALSGTFTIEQLRAMGGTLEGSISYGRTERVLFEQPIVFSSGGTALPPLPLDPTVVTTLAPTVRIPAPVGAPTSIPVTVTDPHGLVVTTNVTPVDGEIVLPITDLLQGEYDISFTSGGTTYFVQRRAVVPEPGSIWLFAPALLSVMMVGAERRMRRRPHRKASACPRLTPFAVTTLS